MCSSNCWRKVGSACCGSTFAGTTGCGECPLDNICLTLPSNWIIPNVFMIYSFFFDVGSVPCSEILYPQVWMWAKINKAWTIWTPCCQKLVRVWCWTPFYPQISGNKEMHHFLILTITCLTQASPNLLGSQTNMEIQWKRSITKGHWAIRFSEPALKWNTASRGQLTEWKDANSSAKEMD